VLDTKITLITLLVKLGVAAAVSAGLARSRVFKRLLFSEKRTAGETAGLLAFILVPLTLGVGMRFWVPNWYAGDIAFETVIIIGVLIGPVAALVSAVVLAVPTLVHHEYLTLPFNLAVAILAGIYGRFVEKEEAWSFSPFVDLSIYRWIRRNLRKPRFDRQILLLILIVALEISREWIAHIYPHRLFALTSDRWVIRLLIWTCAAMVVGIPLKIWNALRIEEKLEEQKRLLLEARFDALQRQINPHFLFNTLNSIASLVRFRPELAREMIVKLANILRALLRDRFGAEKLKVVKEIDPDTLGVLVPSILLQPLIENSIKHGLEPRVSGGTITVRSRITDSRLVVEVEDDGVGISSRTESSIVPKGAGIGMRNVRERLEVLYGDDAQITVTSRPGRGTLVVIELPLTERAEAVRRI
jgi:two-component system LytT family sensor kinase